MKVKILLNLLLVTLLIGASSSEPTVINLVNRLAPSQGYKVSAGIPDDGIGSLTQMIGDIDNDGISDFAIASLREDTIYVVYGQANTTSADINLANMTSSQGFKITGIPGSFFGDAISPAGDFNQDGADDFMVGAVIQNYTESVKWSGAVYVIYGQKGTRNTDIDLSQGLDPSRGFVIISKSYHADLGTSLAAVGDMNNDNYPDIAIGCSYESGSLYIIYGSQDNHNFTIEDMTPQQGFKINAPIEGANLGYSVASGDFNNDTLSDIIVSALDMDVGNAVQAGVVFVIYGNKNGIADIDLANLTPEQGFRILGSQNYECLGNAIACAGDLNHDGIDDIVAGVQLFTVESEQLAGSVYVIYGQNGTRGADINLADDLDPSQGFMVLSSSRYSMLGYSVSRAGDVNHDGIDDLILGTVYSDYMSNAFTGAAIVVYGKSGGGINTIDLGSEFNITQGFIFIGPDCSLLGYSVSSGDFDGDGYVDLLIGAQGYPGLACTPPGAAYVIHLDCASSGCAQCYGSKCLICSPGYVLDPFNGKCYQKVEQTSKFLPISISI